MLFKELNLFRRTEKVKNYLYSYGSATVYNFENVFVKKELLKIKGVDQKLWKCEFEDYGPF